MGSDGKETGIMGQGGRADVEDVAKDDSRASRDQGGEKVNQYFARGPGGEDGSQCDV